MNKYIKFFIYYGYSLGYWLLLILAPAGTARALSLPRLHAGGGALPSAVRSVSRPQGSGVLVVVRGNSQAHGALTTGGSSAIGSESTGAWPDQAAALLGSGYTWQNRSKNGATIDYLRLSDNVEVAPLFGTGQYAQEWIVLQETTNQIFQGNSAQQVYDKMVAWAQYWQARGVKVAVVTCYATQDPQYNPKIDAINALYRANWTTFCDMLLDVRSSSYITQLGMHPQYGYAADDLHLNSVGNQIPAHCAVDGFASASRTGIIPATFALSGIAAPGLVSTAPLPVELVAFTAQYVADQSIVHLNWATASENASALFEVERSTNGTGFTRIGSLAAAVSSTMRRTYYLSDVHLPVGSKVVYYRLRQIDVNGSAHYSLVRSIEAISSGDGLVLYPNPARALTTLKNAAPGALIHVFDALGHVRATFTADNTGKAELTLPLGLANGLYIVRAGSQSSPLLVQDILR